MRRFLTRSLTLALAAHWMCVFATLAAVCALEPGRGFAGPLLFLGAEAGGIEENGGSPAAAFFAIAFAFAAVLFLLPVAELLFERGRRTEPDLRRAFAASAASLTLLLLAGAFHAVPNLLVVLHTVLAAALVSYLAVNAERRAPEAEEEGGPGRDAARSMARAAAHGFLLSKLSGRNRGESPNGRQ